MNRIDSQLKGHHVTEIKDFKSAVMIESDQKLMAYEMNTEWKDITIKHAISIRCRMQLVQLYVSMQFKPLL